MDRSFIRTPTRIEAKGSWYDFRGALKTAGFRWDPESKVWWTTDASQYAEAAKMLRDDGVSFAPLPDSEADEAPVTVTASLTGEGWSGEVEPLPEDVLRQVSAHGGVQLYPFQIEAVRLLSARKRAVLADEMGLGKTIESLALARGLVISGKIDRVLIVCPPSLRMMWRKAAAFWLWVGMEKDRVMVLGYTDAVKRREEAAAWVGEARTLVILDESHAVKNRDAKRTQALLGGRDKVDGGWIPGIIDKAERVIFATGSPILSRPVDLWTTVRVIDREGLGQSFRFFAGRYCAARYGRYGLDVSGASHLEELSSKLARFTLRRTKQSVGLQLPEKIRSWVPVGENGLSQRTAKEAMLRSLLLRLYRLDGIDFAAQAAGASADSIAEMTKMRHDAGLKKVPHVVSYVEDLKASIDEGEPVVVFAWHQDVLDALRESMEDRKMGPVVIYDGRTAADARAEIVDRFQRGEIPVLLVQIAAGGVGITLTRARHAIFAEHDWTPGLVLQAEDRIHRIGQDRGVQIHHLYLEGSIDAYVLRILRRKVEVLTRTGLGEAQISGGVSETEIVEAMIEDLGERRPRVLDVRYDGKPVDEHDAKLAASAMAELLSTREDLAPLDGVVLEAMRGKWTFETFPRWAFEYVGLLSSGVTAGSADVVGALNPAATA